MRDDGRFGREAFDVLCLAPKEALRDEQREVRVAMSRLLEHVIESALHALPDAVAVRPNDHAAADRRIVGKLGAEHDLVVPGAEVFRPCRELLVVCHLIDRESKFRD